MTKKSSNLDVLPQNCSAALAMVPTDFKTHSALPIFRHEMILNARFLSRGYVGGLDLNADRTFRHEGNIDLHRQAEFAGLILSDIDQQPAVGCPFVAHDVEHRAQ